MPLPKLHEVDIWNRALARIGDARIELEADIAVSSVTAANPPVATTGVAHNYATGDRSLIYDLADGTGVEMNGRVFRAVVLTGTTFSLYRETGLTYVAGGAGLVARLPSVEVVRACFDAWPRIRDEIIRAAPWNSTTRRTRLARLQAAKAITAPGATLANPVVLNVVGHAYVAGDEILVDGIVGTVELNGRYFTVGTVLTANTFELAGIDGLLYTAYASGGTTRRVIPGLQPDFGYGYRYTVPEDCMRVFELAQDPNELWELEGDQLHCNVGPTVPIRYARRITDPELWDPQLVNVMAARLAYEIADELSASSSRRDAANQFVQDAIDGAKRADAQEQSPQDFTEDDWVIAATGGGSFDPLLPCTPRGTR